MEFSRRRFVRSFGFGGILSGAICGNANAHGRKRRREYFVQNCPLPSPIQPNKPDANTFRPIERSLREITNGRAGDDNPGEKFIVDFGADPRPQGQRAFSLHMGVNWVDEGHYGRIQQLGACLYDAQDMSKMATAYGFAASNLTNTHATTANVKKVFADLATILKEGDIFLLTYSGHGSNILDIGGDERNVGTDAGGSADRFDDLDETWVLWDRMLVDDELYAMCGAFEKGVRILIFLDSCHSGTALKSLVEARNLRSRGLRAFGETVAKAKEADRDLAYLSSTNKPKSYGPVGKTWPELQKSNTSVIRCLREAEANDIYRNHKALYDGILGALPPQNPIRATAMLLSACQDAQTAKESGGSGVFTFALNQIFSPLIQSNRKFAGNYRNLVDAVTKIIADRGYDQAPNLFPTGQFTQLFQQQTPFELAKLA